MAAIQIIVGSVMGTALEVAESLANDLRGLGHQVRVNAQFRKGELDGAPTEILLICTSSTGMGDLPMNIVPFYNHLKQDSPPLFERRYGLITLGDSSYPNFAQAGRTLDEALLDLGARRLGEPLVLDAIYETDPGRRAREWARQWSELL